MYLTAETLTAEDIRGFLSSVTLERLLPTAAVLVVGTLVVKLLLKLVKKSLEKTKMERSAASLIRSVLKVTLYLLVCLMAASSLGLDVSGIVALASVVSLALSLSLQDALSNVIGGFTLLTTHPFRSGDYVEIAGLAGTVQTIDITYTKLTTPDNKTISIPNSSVVSSQIVNYSTSGTRRIDITIRTTYDAPIDEVKAALLRAARVDTVLSEPAEPLAAVRNYGESAMEFILQVWTASADYWPTLFAINENISRELKEAGIAMTYPHVNVHLDK